MNSDSPTGRQQGASAPLVLETSLADNWRLAIEFHWRADRFEHRFVAIDSDAAAADRRTVLLAETVDEPAELAWPANPPLQQLDECWMSADRRGLVGVGMAGTSHWSVAIESADRGLWLDIACRIQQAPGDLRSCYGLSGQWQPAPLGDQAICLRRSTIPFDLPLNLWVDERSTKLACASDGTTVVFRPLHLPSAWPATVRWRYGLGIR